MEQTFLRFQSATAREQAIRRADEGNFEGTAASLREALAGIAACPAAPDMAEEMQDLDAEAVRLESSLYEASDMKYYGARALLFPDAIVTPPPSA